MIGKLISHYKILEELGQGGMGVVYKAEDTKLKRPVALKFLPADLTRDEDAKERFVHEAQAASALDHPNICTIHEIEETQDGHLFIVMAYYEGETLQKKVDSGSLIVDSAIDIAIQIAQGLAKAHAHGIVHRDLKPANIIVTKEGMVKIVDFGLALLADRPRLTKTGSTVGTMAYMSPEQARGEQVDHRTDIWALGVVVYEMLAGQLPFKGEYEHAVMYSILNVDPAPIRSLHAGVPAVLEEIVDKALQKRPGERYQDVNELLVELKLTAKGLASQSASTSRNRFPKRKPAFLQAGLTAVLISLVAIGIYFFPEQRNPIDSIAVLPLVNLSGDANQDYFADGMTEALISVLGQIEALRVISRTSVMQYKGGTKPLPAIAQELNVDAVVEGSVVHSGAQVNITVRLIEAKTEKRLWSQSFERELREVLRLQREVALAIVTEIEVRITTQESVFLHEARTIDPKAYEHYLWGKKFKDRETPESLQEAVKHWEQVLLKEQDFAPAYAELGKIYPMLGLLDLIPADEAESKARHNTIKALELDKTNAEAHIGLGWIRLTYDWDWSGAEVAFKQAIELDPGSREAHSSLSLFLSFRGRSEEALTEIKHAQALDPLSEQVNISVGEVHIFGRQYDAAIEQFQRVLATNPSSGWAYLLLGEAYLLKGMYAESISALKTKEAASLGIPDTFAMLGCAYALIGNREQSLKKLDELKERHKQGLETHVPIAMVYTCLSEQEEALTWLEQAYEARSNYLVILILDPVFDQLRTEPRYQALLKKMGLEKSTKSSLNLGFRRADGSDVSVVHKSRPPRSNLSKKRPHAASL
ncbi:MAG: protein kinase domain-containing protein [bacterium]